MSQGAVFAFLPVFVENTNRWIWWKFVYLCFTDYEDDDDWLYGPIRWYEEILDE